MTTFKCLSIQQPYASLIVGVQPGQSGPKDIENRDWRASYKGLLLIHAGKRLYDGYRKNDHDPRLGYIGDLPLGAVVGVANLVGYTRHSDSPWFCGVWGWLFRERAALLSPIPLRGQLGLFDVTLQGDDEAIVNGMKREFGL